jgi:hypothetical protein
VIFNVISLSNNPKRTEDQELNPVVHQITTTEHQIKYHEQTLSGSIAPYRIETIQVTLSDRLNMSFNLEKGTLWSPASHAADRFRITSSPN